MATKSGKELSGYKNCPIFFTVSIECREWAWPLKAMCEQGVKIMPLLILQNN